MKYHSPLLSGATTISALQKNAERCPAAAHPALAQTTPRAAANNVAGLDDHRWSEVVPPDSGLKFAVVWDPEQKDLVTFSSAELWENESDSQSPDSPTDAFDNRSQLTFGLSTQRASEYTATLDFLRENHGFKFNDSAYFPSRPMAGRTQTSSTLDGLDVYLRGSMLGKAHNANRYYSCFQDLDGDFAFDPQTSFAYKWMQYMKGPIRDDISDEGFSEGGLYSGMDYGIEANLSSKFSMTTTSTSNFVTVNNEMDFESSTAWSNLEAPNTPGYSRLMFNEQSPFSGRRLRKTRHPASPIDVLNRPQYNHDIPPPPPSVPFPKTPPPSEPVSRARSPVASVRTLPAKLARSLSSKPSKKAEPAGWVWIDVTEKCPSPTSP